MSEKNDKAQSEYLRQELLKRKSSQDHGKSKVKSNRNLNSKQSSHQSSRVFRRKPG